MRKGLRKSGIDIIGNVPWGTHFCQFYQTKKDLIDVLAPYFKTGLENNELCVWIISQPLDVEEAKEAMEKAIPDLNTYLEKRQIIIISQTCLYFTEDIFNSKRALSNWVEELNNALNSGYDGLRFGGDISWQDKGSWNHLVEYEKHINNIFNNYQIITLCAYPLNKCNAIEIIDVVSNHQFALVKKEGEWAQTESSACEKTTRCLRTEEQMLQSEQPVWFKGEKTLSPAREMANLELSEIVDTRTIQSLMDNFYKLAKIPMGINDLKGNVLAGAGWQEICTRFHRIHPKACKHCVESDIYLSAGVSPGEFKLYKCKNNMWDLVTPILVGGQKVGYIFAGQFFFDDEPLDYDLFRFQARKYGFDEEEYIAALEKVPRLSRETVNRGMAFLTKLANMISQLSYSNVKLTQSLVEHDALVRALRESEERYRSLYENSLDGILLTKPDGTILSANPQACIMFGMSEDEIIRSGRESTVVNDEKLAAALEERTRTGRMRAELTHRRKDGSTFICDTTSRTFVDADGSISTSLIIRDITERKQIEEALRASEEKFRKIVETAKEGIWLIDSNERTVFVNQVMSEMLGYSIEEIMGQSPRKFISQEFRAKMDDRFREHMQGFSQVVDYRFIRKDGSDLWCIVSSSPLFDDQRKYAGSLAMFTNITERKKAEEALRLSNTYNRSLIEASLDPLVTIGRDGKITDVNNATEQVTGYSRSELIGTDFSDYFTEPEKALTGYRQVFTYGEVRDYPLEIQHKNGHVTPVLYNASVFRDEKGEVIGVFADARDITERRNAEEALKKANDNLEKIVEERTIQLEKAYNSLKESQEGLSEAQKIAHIGNWEWDIATGKTYWSDELHRIFGLKPQESTPTSDEFFNYIHPDDREYVVNAIKAALKGKPYGGIDYRIILDNGEEHIVNAKSEVIFDEENIPILVKGTIQDITGRKKTEEKIQILANAVESSNDAIVTESLDGIVTSWNKAAEQIYGYSAEEILGKSVSILEPDNIKGETKTYSERIKQGKKVQHYETFRIKKDGSIINISVTLSPVFNVSGELVALSAIVRDITERKREEKALRESEARLRRFYESGMFGVLYYHLDGSITEANDKFLEIVGYTREDLEAGQVNWVKMTPKEYCLVDESAIEELKTAGANVICEKEYIRKDGSHVPIMLGIATFDQTQHEGIAFVFDITERKKTEKALAEIDKVRIKEIHHRIKNNLQVISSLLDLQAEKFQDKEVLEAFKESQNRVISMSLIHEELYKGKENDTLDFSEYLRELTKNLFRTYNLSSKNICLFTDLEKDAFFDMDTAVPLGIIVNELISNSLKHAFNGVEKGEIRVRLCREERKNEINESHFSLTIADNGKGIPEDIELGDLDSLGLQLVRALVDQLDGEIEIKKAHGTEFIVTFNVAEDS